MFVFTGMAQPELWICQPTCLVGKVIMLIHEIFLVIWYFFIIQVNDQQFALVRDVCMAVLWTIHLLRNLRYRKKIVANPILPNILYLIHSNKEPKIFKLDFPLPTLSMFKLYCCYSNGLDIHQLSIRSPFMHEIEKLVDTLEVSS